MSSGEEGRVGGLEVNGQPQEQVVQQSDLPGEGRREAGYD